MTSQMLPWYNSPANIRGLSQQNISQSPQPSLQGLKSSTKFNDSQKIPTDPWNILQVYPKIQIWFRISFKQVVAGLGSGVAGLGCSVLLGTIDFSTRHCMFHRRQRGNHASLGNYHPTPEMFNSSTGWSSSKEVPLFGKNMKKCYTLED